MWQTTFKLNPNAGSSAGAFNQGHNLYVLTLTNAASYVTPVFPPSCWRTEASDRKSPQAGEFPAWGLFIDAVSYF
ncbi:MAG: hypothetical protein KA368_03345 [Acidobacteria bacterium]|nr:hypothetical protein [Acidobacteriota bacterium]